LVFALSSFCEGNLVAAADFPRPFAGRILFLGLALQWLLLHCMPLTVDEILAHEEALQKEITDKQALLAAYQLLRAQTAG